MYSHELLDQCEADARPLMRTSLNALDTVKALKYVRQFVLWYADTCVPHG
jgi:hypothetical protein